MRVCSLLTVALLWPTIAFAERVHLQNGRVIEGEVTREDGQVVVKTPNGIEVRLDASKVLRIESGPTKLESYEARLEALDGGNLRAHRQLAAWAEDEGLRRQARECRETILARWPDDAPTRAELGFVRHEEQWITRQEYMRSLGLVPADEGRTWISEEEALRRGELDQARARAPEIRKLLRSAWREEPQLVGDKLQAYEDDAALPVLTRHVRHRNLRVRQVAMSELGRRQARVAVPKLAEAAVEDTKLAGRDAAIAALKQIPNPGVERYFLRSLRRENPFQRVHAVKALSAFPSRHAVPAMITLLRESTGGFGRVSISIITQRAYIRDFEISAGGTGLVVAEVADPVVDTFTEGVTLDTKVVLWERYTLVTALQRVTGQEFGADPEAWERWWRGAKDEFEVQPGD